MKFTRLKLVGFKTFVDPTEILIEPGLSGVVGPNGCGKSNLVEALRWVMGESSYKAMRASGMDDVIFSGSSGRPARNSAEVAVLIDNAERRAPPAFNDNETLEISRRIEREAGSVYRVNGRDVRARDVQLLFADASTGSRSPSLVRQGQIGELISAKPESRRLILEEAAGISGLHSRRQEAETRLKAAEQNLERVDDVVTQLRAQLDSLRRQARQAQRYRAIAAEIRRVEATLLLTRHVEAVRLKQAADEACHADRARVAEFTTASAEASKHRAIAAHVLPKLREEAQKANERVQKVAAARQALDIEERRAADRAAELERRLAQLGQDIARERAVVNEAREAQEKLREEHAAAADAFEHDDLAAEAEARREEAERVLAEAAAAYQEALTTATALDAKRAALQRALQDAQARLAREQREAAAIEEERRRLEESLIGLPDADAARGDVEAAEEALLFTEESVAAAERRLMIARERETAARDAANAAEKHVSRLEAEAATLRKMLAIDLPEGFAPVLSALGVQRGYETALGAALGEDLEAPEDSNSPAHWRALDFPEGDPALPHGATPLSDFVEGPNALGRRLRQIGVVERVHGATLQASLATGQRLVSLQGDVWRWDGFTVAADAPTPAARRLAERNRLGEVEETETQAREQLLEAKEMLDAAREEASDAAAEVDRRRVAMKEAQRRIIETRDALARAERARADSDAKRAALQAGGERVTLALEETRTSVEEAAASLEMLADDSMPAESLEERKTAVESARRVAEEARAEVERLAREAALRRARVESIARELTSWSKRAESAAEQTGTLEERQAEIAEERERLEEVPGKVREARLSLRSETDEAERERARAADALAEAERLQSEADAASSAAERAMADARESFARSEARLEAAGERVAATLKQIEETFECDPADLVEIAGLEGPPDQEAEGLQERLDQLKRDRERLGAVNLRAEAESAELETRHGDLERERDDLVEAIARLRQAISNLNREGRERLLSAFTTVNGHFQSLFGTLFGGGTADLQLTESDDPLKAGLDILARPPGKKPQTLTLLSGGEQALTAMALIFAVFLTNPSPICVLDEVDAPLDDANVQRFCDLLDEMRRRTDTRFLVITHNPVTMARMDRLYGVTMVERGVSQLVSVDLATAESFRETA